MNPDHARFAEWDAAFVLGALSAADRRAFEEHLAECADCRRAVAELAPTVGLLSRVSAEQAVAIDADPALDDGFDGPALSTRADVVSIAGRRTRRTRLWWTAAAAAVVLVVAAVAIPATIAAARPAPSFAMSSVADAPIDANVRLETVSWGTRIDLDCRYAGGADTPAEGRPYALAVVAADGTTSTISTWRALRGATAWLSAGTALDVADIRSVEILSVTSGKVLMRYELPS